jgi:GT2 family glycosyltransferase
MDYKYDLSIITVPYNAKELLRKTLEAVFKSETKYSFEVIVVDNDSKDGTSEMVIAEFGDKVKLFREPNNGFSAGNNVGIKNSEGKHILLLNPDTEVAIDCIEKCLNFLQSHPKAGVVTAKLVMDNGEVDPACRRNFPNPINSFFYLFGLHKLFPKSKWAAGYQRGFASDEETQQVDSVNGAFELMTSDCFSKVGLLDEQYFMWGEDIDWCFQAKKAGFEVWYIADAICVHHKGQPHKKSSKMLWVFYDSMFKYYKKNLSPEYPWIVNQIVILGIWCRYGLAKIINSFKTK